MLGDRGKFTANLRRRLENSLQKRTRAVQEAQSIWPLNGRWMTRIAAYWWWMGRERWWMGSGGTDRTR